MMTFEQAPYYDDLKSAFQKILNLHHMVTLSLPCNNPSLHSGLSISFRVLRCRLQEVPPPVHVGPGPHPDPRQAEASRAQEDGTDLGEKKEEEKGKEEHMTHSEVTHAWAIGPQVVSQEEEAVNVCTVHICACRYMNVQSCLHTLHLHSQICVGRQMQAPRVCCVPVHLACARGLQPLQSQTNEGSSEERVFRSQVPHVS